MRYERQSATYWQKIHSLCPSTSLKKVHTSSAFNFFFAAALRRGGICEPCWVLRGPTLGEPWARVVDMVKARMRLNDGCRSGVWGVPSALSSEAGLGERKDSAPGEAVGLETWKG